MNAHLTAPTVTVDLQRIRSNIEAIRRKTKTKIMAVVKADGYGLGAERIAKAVTDLVDGFYVFTLKEAIDARLWEQTKKPTLALAADGCADVQAYLDHRVRPSVWTPAQAESLRRARPVLSVDSGMQRFACQPEAVDATLKSGACDEAFTHATRIEHVESLLEQVGNRGLKLHAAGTALLDEPRAWLDAVRPGLAMYRGAARITAPLIEARDSRGPAGYSGFVTKRLGVILAGYSSGVRVGPCLVNGKRSRILEVGMQSAFIDLAPNDRVGDEVVLLGDEITEADLANEWGTTPQEVLLRLAQHAVKRYVD